MDPNATLAELRSATFNLLHAVDHDLVFIPAEVGRVCELVQAMDEWLSKDGFLPTEWRRTADLAADAELVTWHLATCEQCAPGLPQPFRVAAERDTWADEHAYATGHTVTRHVEERA